MDLFDQRAVADTGDGDYGLSGDMKKTQYVLQLLGAPFCPETLKCILIAAEQGMEMNTGTIEMSELDSAEFNEVSEFGLAPALKENDYFTAGSKAITEFINARGLGTSIIPNNVVLAAEQETWIDKSRQQAEPTIQAFVGELTGQAGDTAAAKAQLEPVLDELNEQLGKDKFILGKNYSMADVHWTADMHLLSLTSGADMITSRSNINTWLQNIRDKKSNCGQSLKAYSLLPTVEDIKANKLNNVTIDDF
ncbi:MAG: glutathione S-transferase C-terminal domain-containing protein [Gammaproteobacteria bacterium]|nr:glutathione S-transferase C-terminal domain-containing protein [Gammaproteobacteria bacterium]